MFGSKASLAAGMVDRIATLDQVVDELSITPTSRPRIAERFGAGAYDLAESRARTVWMSK